MINYGKSALVFRGEKDGQPAAVKVFDREMVERFGREVQQERVLRERDLVGHGHRHLIEILDAGEDVEHSVFFVVMAFFSGKNLAQVLQDFPNEQVHTLITQIADAARFLEDRGFAHRDIKPENIGVSDDFSNSVLLDLGVIRPIGLGSITDETDQKTFVGTLRYSPPELLMREEDDSITGWRAVSFYQLGGVLHDLLTRRSLFAGITPYARLAKAVSEQVVTVDASGPPDLRLLAQNCLVKSPTLRLQLVSWESFQKAPASPTNSEAAMERVRTRLKAAQSQPSRSGTLGDASLIREIARLKKFLEDSIRDECTLVSFPPHSVRSSEELRQITVRFVFASSAAHALPYPLVLFVEGTCIDEGSQAVNIRAAAKIVRAEEEALLEPSDDRYTPLFQGVADHSAIKERLHEFLVLLLDQGQDVSERGLESQADEAWLIVPWEGNR
jgi:serine/threonine protein kinase